MFQLEIDSQYVTRQQIEYAILDFLAAYQPATLEQICRELIYRIYILPENVLPFAITALAALQDQGLITQYEQSPPIKQPMDCAWIIKKT